MQPQECVGIDLHRRRSVIVLRSAASERLEATRVDNLDLASFERAVMAAGEHPEVVIEASYGWYWASTGCKSLAAMSTWRIPSATTGATAA